MRFLPCLPGMVGINVSPGRFNRELVFQGDTSQRLSAEDAQRGVGALPSLRVSLAANSEGNLPAYGAAGNWAPCGELLYCKSELYDLPLSTAQGTDLSSMLVACARAGGPIAMIRDTKKIVEVTLSTVSPILRIFNGSGKPRPPRSPPFRDRPPSPRRRRRVSPRHPLLDRGPQRCAPVLDRRG